LPKSLEKIEYSTRERLDCKLIEIFRLLELFSKRKEWENKGFSIEEAQKWVRAGVRPSDYDFCTWLRDIRKVKVEKVLEDIQILNQEFF
jgi:hypothetical protein